MKNAALPRKYAATSDVAVFTTGQLLQLSGSQPVKALEAKLAYSKPFLFQPLHDSCNVPLNLFAARLNTCNYNKPPCLDARFTHAATNKKPNKIAMSEDSDGDKV